LRELLADRIRSYEAWYKAGFGAKATTGHRLVLQLIPDLKAAGVVRMLDIGCGRGRLFDELAAVGFDVTGTEICPCLFLTDLKKKDVLPYPVDSLSEIEDASYDAVVLCNVLDHLRDEEEVDLALVEAARIARTVVIAVLGAFDPLVVLTEFDPDWWEAKVKEKVPSKKVERMDEVGNETRLVAWR